MLLFVAGESAVFLECCSAAIALRMNHILQSEKK